MSRRGYGFERETEVWLCRIAEQDVHADFAFRSFRTATSGAATSSKGDVRLLHVPWLEALTLECKHLNDHSSKGPTFHLYVDWLTKIAEEATATKAVPALTWAFKNARTHRGEGRVQFAFPLLQLRKWAQKAKVSLFESCDKVKYVEKKSKYFLVYHDELWEWARHPHLPIAFTIPVGAADWGIISRRHIQLIFEALRGQWKEQTSNVSIATTSQENITSAVHSDVRSAGNGQVDTGGSSNT